MCYESLDFQLLRPVLTLIDDWVPAVCKAWSVAPLLGVVWVPQWCVTPLFSVWWCGGLLEGGAACFSMCGALWVCGAVP